MTNKMPELEAGKHIVVDDDGAKYLILADNIAVMFEGGHWDTFKGLGWVNASGLNINEVYQITKYSGYSNCAIGGILKLIWKKPDEKRNQDKYQSLLNEMEELKRKIEAFNPNP